MATKADYFFDRFDELNAQAAAVVSAHRQSTVGETEPQSNRCVPAMRPGDLGVVDVAERCLDLLTAELGDQPLIGGDGDMVVFGFTEHV